MNAQELYLQSGKATGVFYCESCRVVHTSKVFADDCCVLRKCACGTVVPRPYRLLCDSCETAKLEARERAIFEKAEKVTEWDGPVQCDSIGHNDGFFESVEALLDYCAGVDEEVPEYAWACEKSSFVSVTVDDIVSVVEGDAYEDFTSDDLSGLPELETALNKFNEDNKDLFVFQNVSPAKAVLLPRK